MENGKRGTLGSCQEKRRLRHGRALRDVPPTRHHGDARSFRTEAGSRVPEPGDPQMAPGAGSGGKRRRDEVRWPPRGTVAKAATQTSESAASRSSADRAQLQTKTWAAWGQVSLVARLTQCSGRGTFVVQRRSGRDGEDNPFTGGCVRVSQD